MPRKIATGSQQRLRVGIQQVCRNCVVGERLPGRTSRQSVVLSSQAVSAEGQLGSGRNRDRGGDTARCRAVGIGIFMAKGTVWLSSAP